MGGRSCTITRRAISAAALVTVAALALGACRDREAPRIALIGATLIDGTGAPPRRDAVIVIRGDRIESITTAFEYDKPDNTREIDVGGRFVIPGLIDAHAHTEPWALTRYLAYGVTSLRDVHGAQDSVLQLRDQANLNSIASPRIYTAGAMLDGVPATYPNANPAPDAGAARKAVDQLAVAGVDYVKTYTRMTPELLRATVDEAKTFNLRVTAHLGLTDALTASELGVASIEHLSGVPEAAAADASPFYAAHRQGFFAGWNFFERSWAGLDSARLARVAVQLAERKVVLVPTLVLHETFSRLDDPATLRDPNLSVVPAAQRQAWNTPGMIARAGWTAADYEAFRRGRPLQNLFLRAFHRAGGVIAAGTDAANQQLVPGSSEHTEMELLVAAGLTPAEALLAATRNAAQLLGADSIGTLEPGRVADLLILSKNPLADIRNTRAIEQVMLRGTLLRPDSLRSSW